MFTELQKKTVKTIIGIHETGKLISPPDTVVILPGEEKAVGLTVGTHQTTENSGELWNLIFLSYLPIQTIHPKYSNFFRKYQDVLYRRGPEGVGRKGAVTYDQAFIEMFQEAARTDPAMIQAQKDHFEKRFFRAALGLCSDYDLDLPISLAVVFDICIQSGPELATKLIENFNDNSYKEKELSEDLSEADYDRESEKDWVTQLIAYRRSWLAGWTNRNKARQEGVRQTVYRMDSLQGAIQAGLWDLPLPLSYTLDLSKIDLTNKTFEITKEAIENNNAI